MSEPSKLKSIALGAGPIAGLLGFVLLSASGLAHPAALTAGITIWVGVWWIFEPIPIPATSLLPLALLPMFGVLTKEEVGQAYGHMVRVLD